MAWRGATLEPFYSDNYYGRTAVFSEGTHHHCPMHYMGLSWDMERRISKCYSYCLMCISWSISLLLTIQYQVPQVYAVKFFADSVCLLLQDETMFIEARPFHSVCAGH